MVDICNIEIQRHEALFLAFPSACITKARRVVDRELLAPQSLPKPLSPLFAAGSVSVITADSSRPTVLPLTASFNHADAHDQHKRRSV